MSQAQLETKVEDYLRNSQALDDYWSRPITAEQLQTEMDRMARDTKQPDVLRELFSALGNDPFVIAECLVRPLLAERLTADFRGQNSTNPFGSAWLKGEPGTSVATSSTDAAYTIPEIPEDIQCTDDTWTATNLTNAPIARYLHTAVWTGSEMIVWGGSNGSDLDSGGKDTPPTDSPAARSEERRVGEEWRTPGAPDHLKKKKKQCPGSGVVKRITTRIVSFSPTSAPALFSTHAAATTITIAYLSNYLSLAPPTHLFRLDPT